MERFLINLENNQNDDFSLIIGTNTVLNFLCWLVRNHESLYINVDKLTSEIFVHKISPLSTLSCVIPEHSRIVQYHKVENNTLLCV